MTDDSIATVRLPRPNELTTDDNVGELAADTNESAEPGLMATTELKQLLDPAVDEIEKSIDAVLQTDDEGDDDAGFDPYDRVGLE